MAYFGRIQAAILYIHDFAMKYMTATRASTRNIENIELSLSEILPVYLADRLDQPVAVAGDKYCTFGWVEGALFWCGKYVAVSCGIWKNLPRKTVVLTMITKVVSFKVMYEGVK